MHRMQQPAQSAIRPAHVHSPPFSNLQPHAYVLSPTGQPIPIYSAAAFSAPAAIGGTASSLAAPTSAATPARANTLPVHAQPLRFAHSVPYSAPYVNSTVEVTYPNRKVSGEGAADGTFPDGTREELMHTCRSCYSRVDFSPFDRLAIANVPPPSSFTSPIELVRHLERRRSRRGRHPQPRSRFDLFADQEPHLVELARGAGPTRPVHESRSDRVESSSRRIGASSTEDGCASFGFRHSALFFRLAAAARDSGSR